MAVPELRPSTRHLAAVHPIPRNVLGDGDVLTLAPHAGVEVPVLELAQADVEAITAMGIDGWLADQLAPHPGDGVGGIDDSRAAGVDPDAIAGMERSLNDVREAIRSLKPAESFAGFEQAIRNGVARVARTVRNVEWFEATEIRGHVTDGEVDAFQVTLKVGFRLED